MPGPFWFYDSIMKQLASHLLHAVLCFNAASIFRLLTGSPFYSSSAHHDVQGPDGYRGLGTFKWSSTSYINPGIYTRELYMPVMTLPSSVVLKIPVSTILVISPCFGGHRPWDRTCHCYFAKCSAGKLTSKCQRHGLLTALVNRCLSGQSAENKDWRLILKTFISIPTLGLGSIPEEEEGGTYKSWRTVHCYFLAMASPDMASTVIKS